MSAQGNPNREEADTHDGNRGVNHQDGEANQENDAGSNQGGDMVPQPLPATVTNFMATQTQLLQMLFQEVQNIRGNGPPTHSKVTEFMKLRPPVFDTTDDDPLAADDWLRNINKKLNIVAVNDQEKVMLATHQLVGAAGEWWDNFRDAAENPDTIGWEEFQQAFRDYHIPEGIMEMKADEFRALKQEDLTVNQYIKKFMKLARYAPDEVNTDKKKQDRFRKGLNSILGAQLVTHIYPDFNTLMNRAILLEDAHSQLDDEEKRKTHAQKFKEQEGSQRPEPPSYQSTQYMPIMEYNTFEDDQPQPTQIRRDQNVITLQKSGTGVTKKYKRPKVCWRCSHPGHLVADCPYKQGTVPMRYKPQKKEKVSNTRCGESQDPGSQS